MSNFSDTELLRDYARQNSEAVFAELVRRHVNLVYSAALRHVGVAAQAEEIAQAVFIILARKAGRLREGLILEAWLFETTRLTALSFLRGERRRQFREHEAYMQSALHQCTSDPVWQQLSPLLDEAMIRLGQKEREVIMLRFFKDRSLGEVAVALNIKEPAAQMRVIRALEKLRRYFLKRGISSTTAIIAGAISGNSVQAAPAGLAKTISTVALAKGTAASASTLTLTKGALKLMAWTKVKTAIVAGGIVILTAGTATVAVKTFLAPVTIKDAYVKLYAEPFYRGEVLTDLPWEAPSNNVAVRGDIENFDGLPSDSRTNFDFNDKASSAVYLLPKGCTVILFEDAKFDGQQFKLVGTGKVQKISDFDISHPGFDDIASSLRWTGINEIAQQHPRLPMDLNQLEKTPGFALSSSGVNFLHQLRVEGKLPGVLSNEQIIVMLPPAPAVAYPVVLNFQARIRNSAGPWPYHFTVVKTSASDSWQLQKAWRTDADGKIVEEYPVPST